MLQTEIELMVWLCYKWSKWYTKLHTMLVCWCIINFKVSVQQLRDCFWPALDRRLHFRYTRFLILCCRWDMQYYTTAHYAAVWTTNQSGYVNISASPQLLEFDSSSGKFGQTFESIWVFKFSCMFSHKIQK